MLILTVYQIDSHNPPIDAMNILHSVLFVLTLIYFHNISKEKKLTYTSHRTKESQFQMLNSALEYMVFY